MKPTRRLRLAAGSLLPLTLLAAPAVARAHAYPASSDPKVGSTVSPPKQVRIWFDGPLEAAFSSIAVQGPSGPLEGGHARVDPSDPKLLELDVPQLAPGPYHVTWSIVSRDGHRTSGDYTFTVR